MAKAKKNKKKIIILVVTIAVLALGLIGTALHLKYKKNSNTDTTTKSQNPNNNSKSTYPTSGNSSNNPGSSNSSSNSSVGPSTPTGQLLNKHSISLSSTAIESNPDMNSICQTTPGATCDLKLTAPDNSIKYVGSKSVDASGAASFYWNAKNIGLTSGRWKIEAIATLNNKSSISGPDYLQVNP